MMGENEESPLNQTDSDSDHEVPSLVADDTSPAKVESSSTSRARQPSRYPLRSRVDPPERLY